MNVLLAAILATNLIFLGGFLYAFVKFRAIYKQFIDFVTPPADNTPSKLALVCQTLSEMVGKAIVASLKMFFLGSKSGEVRGANAEIGAGLDTTALGGLVNMLPKSVRSSLIKNPALLDYAMNFMNKNKGGSPGAGSQDNGSNHQVKFKL